jgi:hypothetical protein
MEEALTTAAAFGGIYFVIKVFTDFLLKRNLIKAGHVDKAGILSAEKSNENSYPTLKWGLVFLFAGAGLVVIAILGRSNWEWVYGNHAYLPIGIELIAISLGFLVYFIIARYSAKGNR